MFKKMIWPVLGAVLLLAPAAPARAILIELAPSNQTVAPGAGVSVDLNISGLGLGAAPSLGVWELDIGFDAAVLNPLSVTFGGGLDVLGFGSIQSVTSGVGTLNLFELSLDFAADLDLLQADAFTLATLNFDTIGLGTSALTLANVLLGDALGNALTATQIDGASVTVRQAAVPLPEPGTLALFSAGLVLLLCFNRRRPCPT
jgi:hypothetical protein